MVLPRSSSSGQHPPGVSVEQVSATAPASAANASQSAEEAEAQRRHSGANRHSELLRLASDQRAELARIIGARVGRRRECRTTRGEEGQSLNNSQRWLARLYERDLVAREKKALVVDTRRSCGPYLVSIDHPRRAILDGCGQIATNTHGFADPGMTQGLHSGRFDDCLWSNPATDQGRRPPELAAYEEALVARAPAGLQHAAFVTAGGAEANEKAIRMARGQLAAAGRLEGRRRILAFRDGFHGRTFCSLMATWNPTKRAPFELEGYEAIFVEHEISAFEDKLKSHGHEVYAVIVEPMMAEGGDVHLSSQFLRGVRQLTRAHGIPLIVDEVQTGMGTGGDYFWWSKLGLGDDEELAPDFLTLAKKAGLGVVLSKMRDDEPAAVGVASALRGLIALEQAHEQWSVTTAIESRLATLAERYAQSVSQPRCEGVTFAFDLPDADRAKTFIARRFFHDLMTYPAGERTIRFRLTAGYSERDLDHLFAKISGILDELQEGLRPTTSTVSVIPAVAPARVEVTELEPDDWPQIVAIEAESYESARAADRSQLEAVARDGIALVAREGQKILGFCFGAALEYFDQTDGPRQDPHLGRMDTFYSYDVTVAQGARGRGVGALLKSAQLQAAKDAGYDYVTGRNRVGAAGAMADLNRSLGAFVVERYVGQYGGDGEADYYRISLIDPEMPLRSRAILDFRSGLQAPFGRNPAMMGQRDFEGPLTSKLNLSNWATPDLVHYVEHLAMILPPGCEHLYFTSSADECVDKGLRCLRLKRSAAQVAISLSGSHFGTTTAAARSLSSNAGRGPGFHHFDWPEIPHPAEAGVEASVAALEKLVADQGAESILALAVESIGSRSGHYLDGASAEALAGCCRRHGIPFVVSEHAGGYGRSGDGIWACSSWPEAATPDMVWWTPGGQLGHVFVCDTYWVGKPLTLISTWDGDEVSMIRAHEQLRSLLNLDLGPAIGALDEVLSEFEVQGVSVRGRGLFRALDFGDVLRAKAFLGVAAKSELLLAEGLPGTVLLVPRLDISPSEIRGAVASALRGALNGG